MELQRLCGLDEADRPKVERWDHIASKRITSAQVYAELS
jgi:hypothetical protein